MRSFIQKYKEIVLYIFWGVMTTVVNWISYAICMYLLPQISATAGTVIAWVITVIFAYVTNKQWVFENKSWKPADCVPELFRFTLSRVFSGLFETACMWLFVDYLQFNGTIFGVRGFIVKVLLSVIVIALNYIFSKLWVFRKEKKT